MDNKNTKTIWKCTKVKRYDAKNDSTISTEYVYDKNGNLKKANRI